MWRAGSANLASFAFYLCEGIVGIALCLYQALIGRVSRWSSYLTYKGRVPRRAIGIIMVIFMGQRLQNSSRTRKKSYRDSGICHDMVKYKPYKLAVINIIIRF